MRLNGEFSGRQAATNQDSSNVGVTKYDTIKIPDRYDSVSVFIQKQADNIVADMFKAIDGMGTDDKLFEKTLERLNENNAGAVWDLWERTCGKHYNENFYESFLGDASKSQKAKFSENLQNLFKKDIKLAEDVKDLLSRGY